MGEQRWTIYVCSEHPNRGPWTAGWCSCGGEADLIEVVPASEAYENTISDLTKEADKALAERDEAREAVEHQREIGLRRLHRIAALRVALQQVAAWQDGAELPSTVRVLADLAAEELKRDISSTNALSDPYVEQSASRRIDELTSELQAANNQVDLSEGLRVQAQESEARLRAALREIRGIAQKDGEAEYRYMATATVREKLVEICDAALADEGKGE